MLLIATRSSPPCARMMVGVEDFHTKNEEAPTTAPTQLADAFGCPSIVL